MLGHILACLALITLPQSPAGVGDAARLAARPIAGPAAPQGVGATARILVPHDVPLDAPRSALAASAWPRLALPLARAVAAPPVTAAPAAVTVGPGAPPGAGPQLGGTSAGVGGVAAKPSPVPGEDCNGNGISDAFEIWQGTAQDCQADGIPDECQLATELIYLRDDGIMNVGLTWPHDHLAWLCGHRVQAGHEIVTGVEIAWGLMPAGSPATAVLWADPNDDGDPTDAFPLIEVPITASEVFTGNFVRIDIPDTPIGPAGTSFFVGVYGMFSQGDFPVGFDTSFASFTSFLVAADTPIQPDNLLAGAVVAGVLGDGDWTVRAVSCPGGHCGESVDIDFSGVPDACEPQDCNGNLVPDAIEIALGAAEDCNLDGVPDACQIATGVVYSDAATFNGGVGTDHDYYAWLTHAVIEPGGETITSIQVAYGAMDAAIPVTTGLWSDPNGDGIPDDAQLLVSAETVSAHEFSGQYVDVNIVDTLVGPAGTSFFVGAWGEFDPSWFAAGFDLTDPDQGSWFISHDAPIDPDNLALGAAEFDLIGQLCACDFDWTLRAVSCPTGHCSESGDINGNDVPDECDPDCDGNGIPDDLDIATGAATDCNANDVPDVCEALPDCDDNGLPDLCQAQAAFGLAGEYYANEHLVGAPISRIDEDVDFDFDLEPPFSGAFPTDHFSVRWTGSIVSTAAGTYTFGVVHDDGARLWVNGKLLVDEWHASGGDLDTGTIDLAASSEYYLRLEYYEGNGGAIAQLLWQPPGGSLLPVLPTDLRPIYDRDDDGIPDGCQVPDCNGNGIDDVDDILSGVSLDLDGDLTPDECEPCEDCDGNHYPDALEATAGQGLLGQYFGTTGSTPMLTTWYGTQLDATVDFNWGTLGPALVPGDNDFGVRWTGRLSVPATSGDYDFHLQADDGVRFWLDGTLLVDEWHPSSGSQYTVTANLVGGSEHLLRIDYYEGGGDALVSFRWTPPGGVQAVVPSSALSPDTDLDGDGVPDACTADCDLDGLIDALEADLDGDCVPDDCQSGAGYWRFEEASGALALDDTLNGLDGTLNALPVRVDDVPVATVPLTGAPDAQSLSLEWQSVSSGGLVSVPDLGGLLSVPGTSFTLEAWVRLDTLSGAGDPNQRQWLFMKKPAAAADSKLEYGLLVQSGDLTGLGSGPSGRELLFRYGDGTGVFDVKSHLVVDDLEWHFVSVAYDASRHLLRFGLDGDFDTRAFEKPALANTGALLLGAHENQSAVKNQFLRGAIDEVRFTRAFLPPELLLDSTP